MGACTGPWAFSQKFNIAAIVGFKVLWVGFYYFCQNIRSCWARPSSWHGSPPNKGRLTQRSIEYLAINIYIGQRREPERKIVISRSGGSILCKISRKKKTMGKKRRKKTHGVTFHIIALITQMGPVTTTGLQNINIVCKLWSESEWIQLLHVSLWRAVYTSVIFL